MKTKARKDSIRKRDNFEEKYSSDPMSNAENERRSHRLRALIATGIVLVFFTTYISELYEVQVSEHSYYTVKSDSNRIRIRPVQATRGLIYDRNGKTLADNINTFNLIVKKELISDKEIFLQNLQKLLALNPNQIKGISQQFQNRRLKDITILEDISLDDFSKIAVDRHVLPEIELVPKSKRRYLSPYAMSHVLGYVAKVSDDDIESDVVKVHEGMTEIGKLGIERFYQNILSGKPGYEKLETDAKGKVIRVIEKKQPVRGDDI